MATGRQIETVLADVDVDYRVESEGETATELPFFFSYFNENKEIGIRNYLVDYRNFFFFIRRRL